MKGLRKGEKFLFDDKREIFPQILGDPEKNWIDLRGRRYESRDEMLIGNLLYELNYKFQLKSPIHITNFIKEKLGYK